MQEHLDGQLASEMDGDDVRSNRAVASECFRMVGIDCCNVRGRAEMFPESKVGG